MGTERLITVTTHPNTDPTETAPSDAASPARAAQAPPEMTKWVGWVLFGGLLLSLSGMVNVIEGLVAVFNESYYLVTPSGLALEVDYAVWGWILILFGLVLTVTGWGVMAGRTWALVVGVAAAGLNAVVNLAFLAAYPVWTTLLVALDVIVIYALVVHGREARAFRS
ncbi:DUF7144 family membrane protein [Cryptosporangium minutisporangium]|uniref:DUF7144 domain-containing protein n=1 Tax=Cryptosporangium minutisporangium TaxID=113569 RepID=A0ABP6SY29_9ACTN